MDNKIVIFKEDLVIIDETQNNHSILYSGTEEECQSFIDWPVKQWSSDMQELSCMQDMS